MGEMEAMGQLIVNLQHTIQGIRSSMGNNKSRGAELLQATLDRTEVGLRAQAQQFVATQSCCAASGLPAPLPAIAYRDASGGALAYPPPRASSASKSRRPPLERLAAPPPPQPPLADAVRQRPFRQPVSGTRIRAKTTGAGRLLPKQNRLDPLVDAPVLTEEDLEVGLFSLAARGFIPPNVDLTPAMERGVPIFCNRPAMRYHPALKNERPKPTCHSDSLTMVKLDLRQPTVQVAGGVISNTRSTEKNGAVSFAIAPHLGDDGRTNGRNMSFPSSSPLLHQSSSGVVPKLLALPSTYSSTPAGLSGYVDTFCTEVNEAHEHSFDRSGGLELMPLPPPPPIPVPRSEEGQKSVIECCEAAATRISAWWRGKKQRLYFAELQRRDAAIRKLQRAWASSVVKAAAKGEILRRHEEIRKINTKLLFDLGQDWSQTKLLPKIEIHICSLSIPESRRHRTRSYQALQAAQICRIFAVLDPRRDVVLVVPKPIHEDILDYYVKIMQLRGIKNPPGRFQVVVPENMGLMPHLSVTQALLCSPRALRRIRRLVSGRQAMIIPQVVSQSEVCLASSLRLPLIGASVRNMALFSSKSNAKKLCQLAKLPTGPWATDIYDQDDFFASLATLLVKHPKTRMWVFKIDDERESCGHAYIDLNCIPEVVDAVSAVLLESLSQGDDDSSDMEDIEAGVAQVRDLIERCIPSRVNLCKHRSYPDFATWLAQGLRAGIVIQAVPEAILSQTSVHIHLDPDGVVQILGTSEAAMAAPFIRAASWYPHTRGSSDVLREVGLRMGRVLMAKGLVGHASVDVVFHHNPDYDLNVLEHDKSNLGATQESRLAVCERAVGSSQEKNKWRSAEAAGNSSTLPEDVSLLLDCDGATGASALSPYACWVVDVDARLTDEAANLWPLSFVAQIRNDPSTGLLHLCQEEMQDEHVVACPGKPQRWALVSHAAFVPGMSRMNYASLFQHAKMRGVSFDLFNNVGCMFPFLDIISSLFSLLAVDCSPEACARRMAAAMSALAEGPSLHLAAANEVGGARTGSVTERDTIGDLQDGLSVLDVQEAMRNALALLTESRVPAKV